jgi:AraC family transcriptional regulator of adaptative response / DNA-3-methyladenine glycosylase II
MTNGAQQQLILPCQPGYQWPLVREFLARRTLVALETVAQDSYRREVSNGAIVARYDKARQAFVVRRTDAAAITAAEQASLRRVLGCDTPFADIHTALIQAGLTHQQLYFVAIAGCWHPFEALLRAVVGQQVSVTAAIKHINHIMALAQAAFPSLEAFPSPEQCLAIDFSALKMPQRRQQTLCDVCEYVHLHGPLQPEALASLSTIKGIGPWTLNYVRLRGFCLPDVMLENDLIIKRQLAKYPLDSTLAKPWRSYLCLQLWEMSNHD